jgi:hypothetical protein
VFSVISRIRAIVIIAILWAVAWLPLALLFSWLDLSSASPSAIEFLRRVLFYCMWGGIMGAAFALLLAFAGSGQQGETLTMPRTIVVGTLAGMVPPALWLGTSAVRDQYFGYDWTILLLLAATGIMGAVCACGTLLLSRRGSHHPSAAA